jgi:hypothetical protein
MSAGRDWLAFGIAVYGALVASGVAAYQFIRDHPGVKLIMAPYSVAGCKEPNAWGIRIVNHRKRPITIREAGLLGDRGQRLRRSVIDPDSAEPTKMPFPVHLTDGTSFQFFVPLDLELEEQRIPVGAFAVDDLDNVFKVHEPNHSPRRRWEEWRNRKKLEKGLSGRGSE